MIGSKRWSTTADRILEVVRIIDKRVSARPVAGECLVDHSPPVVPRAAFTRRRPARDPGTGRPTKRDRRQLDRFRAR